MSLYLLFVSNVWFKLFCSVVERRADIIKTVLASKAFSRLGGIPAVITDYLPCLRTICRSESQQDKAKHR